VEGFPTWFCHRLTLLCRLWSFWGLERKGLKESRGSWSSGGGGGVRWALVAGKGNVRHKKLCRLVLKGEPAYKHIISLHVRKKFRPIGRSLMSMMSHAWSDTLILPTTLLRPRRLTRTNPCLAILDTHPLTPYAAGSGDWKQYTYTSNLPCIVNDPDPLDTTYTKANGNTTVLPLFHGQQSTYYVG